MAQWIRMGNVYGSIHSVSLSKYMGWLEKYIFVQSYLIRIIMNKVKLILMA